MILKAIEAGVGAVVQAVAIVARAGGLFFFFFFHKPKTYTGFLL